MALNFGVLDQGGPSNFFEGYSQGQEKMQANAMAQQKAAQAQQEFGMRQQEFAAGQADKRRVADSAIVTQRTLAARDALLRAPNAEAARAIVRAQHADPYLGRIRQQFGTLEQDLAEVPDEPTAFQQYKEREAMGAEAFLKQQAGSREFAIAMGGAQAMPQAAPTNAMAPAGAAAPAAPANAMVAPAMSGELQTKLAQLQRLSTLANQTPQVKSAIDQLNKDVARLSPAAPTPPASIAEFERAKTDPGFMRFLQERAAAMRPPAAPRAEPAPTVTQIVDPTNPNQMIAIDAKRYTGGGAGSPGVIGVSGKEPGAALRTNKAEAGKTQLADDLENLRASFGRLDEMRAIPSTARNPLSNIASATAATGIGQTTGRFVGTEAQVEREVINSARTRLVNSIKNATGMSAQQLNSNVELQTMLKSISDPGQPIQAALRIIDDIENAYVKGAGMSKKNAPGGGAPAPAATAPNIDALLNKYK